MSKPRSFFATEETDTLDLGDGYYVELKRGLDYGEESELEGAAVRMGMDVDPMTRTAVPKLEFSVRDQRILMLALYVVDWNLTGADGKPVEIPDALPARRALFSSLAPETAAAIVARIEALRAEGGEPAAISLEGLAGADLDPTSPGGGTATSSPSASPNGSAAPTAMSAARPSASSGRRSR